MKQVSKETTPAKTVRQAFAPLMELALPVVVVALGMRIMGIVDAVMVGRISAEALAAIALGDFYFFTVTVFGMGLMMALDPVISQAVGADDNRAITLGVQRGLFLAVLIGLISSVLLIPGIPLLTALKQPAEIIPVAARYAQACIAGTIPLMIFYALRQILQAMGEVGPIVRVIVLTNMLNIFLNWVFIYGNLGAPALGPVGSGWASSVSRACLGIGLIAVAWPQLKNHFFPILSESFSLAPLKTMFMIGAPIGAHIQLEFGAFGVIALMMGLMGANQMAAHQIAITLASVTFMVPVGIAAAGAVLTGQAVGREDMLSARNAAGAALIAGVAFMAVSGVAMLLLPRFFASLYTRDGEVLAFAAALIPIAGIFQIFDGVQVVSVGVLRGIGDTKVPMVIAILGFWGLGLPFSVYMAFSRDLGPAGLWWGLVVGLGAVSVFLLARVKKQFAQRVSRIVVDS